MSQRNVQLLDQKLGEPGALLQFNGEALLFDAPLCLYNREWKTSILHKISSVLISHRHRDHFGGLDRLFFEVSPLPHFILNQGGFKAIEKRYESYNTNLEPEISLQVAEVTPSGIYHFHKHNKQLHIHPNDSNRTVLETELYTIQAVVLQHGDIHSIAYAYCERDQLKIDKTKLKALSLPPGPWLTTLKRSFPNIPETIEVNGKHYPSTLFEPILSVKKGFRFVYATDFNINEHNQKQLLTILKDADLFLCEASYLSKDYKLAIRNNHQTAASAAELAKAANVDQLHLFHHSRRYAKTPNPEALFLEEAGKIFANVR